MGEFGPILPVVILSGLIGFLIGLSWAAARYRRVIGGISYPLLAACLIGGYSTFFFTAPHIIGALVVAFGCLGVAALRGRSVDGGEGNVVDPKGSRKIRL